MEAAIQPDSVPPRTARARNLVPGLVVACLVWRVVIANALVLSFPGQVGGWARLLIEAPLYGAIALLIRETAGVWSKYHIDALSLIIFLAFGTLLRTSTEARSRSAGIVDALVFLGLSILLVLSLRGKGIFSWRRLRERVVWIPGLSLGCISLSAAVVLPGGVALLAQSHVTQLFGALAIRYALEFFQGMSHAAILEEPLFRGFLWGWLREKGWAERRILVFQMVLFCLAHLPRYWQEPQVLLFSLPAGGLFLGWLAWKTRSVAPTMVAHGIYNAFVGMIEGLVATL